MSTREWDVVIVGGGASGLSAALQLGRAVRSVLVIDAGEPRNRFAEHLHGMPGGDGLPPGEFLARVRGEVTRYGVEVRHAVVSAVADEEERMAVVLHSGERMFGRRIIAASGSWDGLPEIEGMAERWGRDVLHCPYCHGWEVRGRRLGVIATSSAGVHQAELIRQWSDDVVLFSAEAGEIEPDAAARLAARDVSLEPRPAAGLVVEGDRLTGVQLADGAIVPVDALFTVPILKANEAYLDDLALDRRDSVFGGFVKIDSEGRTSNSRVWAVGNVASPAATVPMVVAAGAAVGAAVNEDLIEEECEAAVVTRAAPARN